MTYYGRQITLAVTVARSGADVNLLLFYYHLGNRFSSIVMLNRKDMHIYDGSRFSVYMWLIITGNFNYIRDFRKYENTAVYDENVVLIIINNSIHIRYGNMNITSHNVCYAILAQVTGYIT